MFWLLCLFTCIRWPLVEIALVSFTLALTMRAINRSHRSISPFFHHNYDEIRLFKDGLSLSQPTKSSWGSLLIASRGIRRSVKYSHVNECSGGLIVTWNQMTTSSVQRVNLFQRILTSNGFDSFPLFIDERVDLHLVCQMPMLIGSGKLWSDLFEGESSLDYSWGCDGVHRSSFSVHCQSVSIMVEPTVPPSFSCSQNKATSISAMEKELNTIGVGREMSEEIRS